MASVKKCDRCNKTYDEARLLIIRKEIRVLKKGVIYDEEYDLCPDCQEELREWLKNTN